jgi:transcriptional regulator with XRE-family HTH domain
LEDVVKPEVAFGVVLRRLRHERQLSQEGLALDAGLQRNYISLLERGVNSASLKTIFKISHALQVSATDLIAMVEAEVSSTVRQRKRQ